MINWKKYAVKVGVMTLMGLIYSNPSVGQTNPSEMVIEIEHKVKKGETLYAIGKKYHCSIEELKALNPDIGMLKPGMRVKVKQKTKKPVKSEPVLAPRLNPVEETSVSVVKGVDEIPMGTAIKMKSEVVLDTEVKSVSAGVDSGLLKKPVALLDVQMAPENTFDHVVQKGQSLYSISKKYGVSVAEIKSINQLTSEQISINQKLWIPKTEKSLAALQGSTIETTKIDSVTIVKTALTPVIVREAEVPNTQRVSGITAVPTDKALVGNDNQGGMPEQVQAVKVKSAMREYEKMVTAQIGYDGIQPDRSWVMLNNHKKGEVIAVVNIANKKMVYCTVIGSLPEKGNKQIAISQSVADRLGIAQQNATLQIRYVAP
jgi:LysM repeat protein